MELDALKSIYGVLTISLAMKPVDYVILACAAVALLLVGILLLPSGPSQAALDSAYLKTCDTLKTAGCNADSVISLTALASGRTTYTLGNLCALRGSSNTVECASSCGCAANGGSRALSSTPTVVYSNNPATIEIVTDEQPVDNTTTDNTTDVYYGI